MDSFVTDTQALVKFMMGKKVINDRCHQAYQLADRGESTIIIPAIVLMEMLYLFEKNRIDATSDIGCAYYVIWIGTKHAKTWACTFCDRRAACASISGGPTDQIGPPSFFGVDGRVSKSGAAAPAGCGRPQRAIRGAGARGGAPLFKNKKRRLTEKAILP